MSADILAMLARVRQSKLRAQAQAARVVNHARRTAEVPTWRRLAAALRTRTTPHASAGTGLVRAMLAADRGALEAELADQAAFNSPIRRYTERAEVVHLLSLIGPIMPGACVERTWLGKHGAATVICAALEEGRLDGIVEELHDHNGRVREVTLMLRPHSAMMPAIKRMAAALERNPLPT